MKRIILTLAILLSFAVSTHADLNLIGQGTSTYGTYNLIYDTDIDVTWYDYSSALANWQNQVDWADALSVTFGSNVYDDWRLPITFDQSCYGYNCTNSEMGHLYYTELGNPAAGPLTRTGDFQNLQTFPYWSGTESSSACPTCAWYFNTSNGDQYHFVSKSNYYYGIAVRDGLAVVPEPISSILFLTGGTLLAGRRYFRRRK